MEEEEVIFNIIGILIGAIISGGGSYYFIKEKRDSESRKIYGITTVIGVVIFIGMILKYIY